MEAHPACLASPHLLDRARQGDLVAFARLIAPLRTEFVRAARSIAGPLLSQQLDPEDIFQDALLAAMRSIQGLRATDLRGFRSWFLAIARHRVLLFRREGRTRVRPRHATPLPPSHILLQDGATLELVIGSTGVVEWGEELDERRPHAHPDQLVSLVLHDFFGSCWDTVAFVLDRCSGESARLVHQRARTRSELFV